MYRPEWTVNSIPFKTLNGAINSGLHTFIEDVGKIEDFDKLEVYFGNIDVRHHLCRISDDIDEKLKDLAKRYVEAVEAVDIKEVYIYELLPIEDESIKLPKSGYYKNKPFWCTW